MGQKETRYVFTEDALKRYFMAVFRYGVFRHMKEPQKVEAGWQVYQPASLCERQWQEVVAMEDAARQTVEEVS